MTSAFLVGIVFACLGYDFETLNIGHPGNCKNILESKLVQYQRDSVKVKIALLCACMCICFLMVGLCTAVLGFGGKALGK